MDALEFLFDKLKVQYGKEVTDAIITGYNTKRYTTLRVNTLKATREEVIEALQNTGLIFRYVSWFDNAFIIENDDIIDIKKLGIYTDSKIYLQSLSSMLPPLLVEPKEGESILDMAAAPGGKTTEIACLSNNKALITAVEKNKIRADRLKYNLLHQGANRVTVLSQDASKLDEYFRFDKILLDAPCSGSGTILLNNFNTFKAFSNNLVNASVQAQLKLIKKASEIVKKGGIIVYSTCSILKEENENIVEILLKDNSFELVPIDTSLFNDIPLLPTTIPGTVCVCPNDLYEGFFLAKVKKIK